MLANEGQGRPEIGRFVDAGGIRTNVLEAGEGAPVVLLHGSGPGVSASANWRLTIPALSDASTSWRPTRPASASATSLPVRTACGSGSTT